MDREAEKAGSWYPAEPAKLDAWLDLILEKARAELPKAPPPLAGIVAPHAGLAYSGEVAARAYAWLAAATAPSCFDNGGDGFGDGGGDPGILFVFGAAHRGAPGGVPAVWPDGVWKTPLGDVPVDAELADELVRRGVARADPLPHLGDNAIELQMPFIARLFPDARVVPVAAPPGPGVEALGREAFDAARSLAFGRRAVAVGSTDLTHYGAAFGLMPTGRGPGAVAWTRANSQPFLDALGAFDGPGALAAAARGQSACGAGAAVAAMSFARAAGAERARVLAHVTSAEVSGETASAEHIVDYAAMAFF